MFTNVHNHLTPMQVEYLVRAYLQYVLSCALFIDKIGTRVLAHLLELLRNLKVVRNYAWGATIATQLYIQLGKGAKTKAK